MTNTERTPKEVINNNKCHKIPNKKRSIIPICLSYLAPVTAIFAISSCVAVDAQPLESKEGDVLASENSDICLTMDVDPKIWPASPSADATKQFSHLFLTQMAMAYRDATGQYINDSRIRSPLISNPDLKNSLCQDWGVDIIIVGKYKVVDDDKSVSFNISIQKGSTHFRQTIENIKFRGLSEPGHSRLNMKQFSLLEDMRKRSALIIEIIGLSG